LKIGKAMKSDKRKPCEEIFFQDSFGIDIPENTNYIISWNIDKK
jgi:hypothetical protein